MGNLDSKKYGKRGQQEKNYILKGIKEQGGARSKGMSLFELALYIIPVVNVIKMIHEYRVQSAEMKELDS